MALLGTGLIASLVDDDDEIESDTSESPEGSQPQEDMRDLGASLRETDTGVDIEVGEDETRDLAVIYYADPEEDEFDAYEARFYLVPPETDFSDASWETRDDVPGVDTFAEGAYSYELADFENSLGLELIDVVDLMPAYLAFKASDDTTSGPNSDPLMKRLLGDITANRPYEEYLLDAQTDADALVSFLPTDFVRTLNGAPETYVSESTTGTGGTDWLVADADEGVRLDGQGGDDRLEAQFGKDTLIGGEGNDALKATRNPYSVPLLADSTVSGGAGDDTIRLESGVATGGTGDDQISLAAGMAYGEAGDDRIDANGLGSATVYGGEGNDSLNIRGDGVVGYGGAGDDFLGVGAGATAFGEDGNERIQAARGATVDAGDGDDAFRVWDFHRDEDPTAVLTGGAGADTYDIRIRNAVDGEADDDFVRITDFDKSEDILVLGNYGASYEIDTVEIVEATDGSHTDLRITHVPDYHFTPGVTIIRLDGVTGLTEDHFTVEN